MHLQDFFYFCGTLISQTFIKKQLIKIMIFNSWKNRKANAEKRKKGEMKKPSEIKQDKILNWKNLVDEGVLSSYRRDSNA